MYPDDLLYTTEHEWLRRPGEAEGSVRGVSVVRSLGAAYAALSAPPTGSL